MAGLYVIIAGAGKVGWNLARELLEKGHEVTVIEQDRRRYLTVEQELEHAVQYGDATELWVLERAGIQRADLVVAVTGDDEDNLLICQVAKEKYLCERIIARCNNPRNLVHFKLLGIQPAVSATDLILRLIEHEVPRYGLVHLLDLPEERLEIIELVVADGSPRPASASPTSCCPTARSSSPSCARLGLRAEGRHGRRGRRRGARRPRPGARGRHHAPVRRKRQRAWLTAPAAPRACSSSAAAWRGRRAPPRCVRRATTGRSLVGREPDAPYQRPPASKGYLRGEMGREDVLVHPPGFWQENDVELLTRTSVMKLDVAERTAALSDRQTVRWDRALLACGANVRRLRVEGGALEGIHYLRTLGNSDAIRADAEQAERVVLVGGSYIACEVAASLTAGGRRCTMVMPEALPLSLGFGETAGRFFADVLRAHGVEVITGDGLARLEGSERVERVVCESGRAVLADLVVIGAGALPDVMLARSAGLELGDSGGVRCSRELATSAPGVWAAGDLCEYDSVLHGRRLRIEHFEVAAAQGAAAARAMLGRSGPFAEVPYFWSDLADWCTVEYVGPASSWDREVVRGAPGDGAFTLFHLAGGRLAAALTVGRSEDLDAARRWLAEGTELAGHEQALGDLASDLGAL